MNKHQIKRKKAFTLVELIIVITILAILSTIAFVGFQNFTKDSRDGNRITTLKNIESGLSLYTIRNNNYPDPDELVEILGTGNILLSKQGIVGNEVVQKIKLNKEALDPKDKTNYIYSITGNGKKYQLGTYLEENKLITYLPQITKTYANVDYSKRYFYTIGNKVGILLEDETQKPILKTQTLTGINLETNTGSFKVYFSNDTQSGSYTSSGTELITTIVENQKTTQVKQQPKNCETTPHNGTKVFYKEESVPYLGTCSEGVEFRCDNGEWKNEIETKQDYPYVLPCVVGTPNNCEATTINNYSIPQTNHNTKTNPTPTKTDTIFTNGTKILSQNFICNNGNFQLEGSESFEITNCNSGYYNNNGTSCETQWSGDATNGYVFKNTFGTTTYPKSCNDLLVSTIPNFKVSHTNSPYSSGTNKFVDGVYFIKPDTSDAFKVYCDMTTDGGGWTIIVSTTINQSNYDVEDTGYDISKSWSWKRIFINKLTFTNIAIKYAEGNFQKLSYNSTYQSYYNGNYAAQVSLDNCTARTGSRCGSSDQRISWGFFCRNGNPFTTSVAGSSNSAWPGQRPSANSDNLGTKKCTSSDRIVNGTEFGTFVMIK